MNFILLGLVFVFQLLTGSADEDFIVNTSKCKIPYFPAFSYEANLTYFPQNYTRCSDIDPLTYTTVKNNTAYLHIREENKIYYSSEEELFCCYSYVTRNGTEDEPDVGISISPCTDFNATVLLTQDIVIVKCYKDYTLVYENVHSPITVPTQVKEKLEKFSAGNASHTPISVLFVVIDSVSRLNLARTMPETRNFLLENDFLEFIGYNKIDDNTFPNFNALLTGLNLRQSTSICKPTEVGKLDECPMIWYDFRKQGYVTAYGEDWGGLTTYNYMKKGFKNPPTDYYFKPYIEAAETLNVIFKDTMPYCAGPETEGERILHLAKDFAVTFKNQPSFGIFWMNTFSHNYINSPTGMDGKMKNFFQELREEGILNSSIVILLSDHGIRFGEIRLTIQGWYEERLPVNLISVPPWFRTRFPKKYDNLKKNSKKLTSTYDLYMTLQDVLDISVQNYNVSASRACPKCSSLFSEIPNDRSCQDAGIFQGWCTCLGKFNKTDYRIDSNATATATQLALRKILQFDEYSSYVYRIISVSISSVSSEKGYYLIVFETDVGHVYQVLFAIKENPVKFEKLLQVLRLA